MKYKREYGEKKNKIYTYIYMYIKYKYAQICIRRKFDLGTFYIVSKFIICIEYLSIHIKI